jgi:hypothetical protein
LKKYHLCGVTGRFWAFAIRQSNGDLHLSSNLPIASDNTPSSFQAEIRVFFSILRIRPSGLPQETILQIRKNDVCKAQVFPVGKT